jgi:hypothetical protein
VLGKETDQELRRTIVTQLVRVNSLLTEHIFENLLALATSLDALMHIEVEDAKRVDLFDRSRFRSNEKVLFANFEQ